MPPHDRVRLHKDHRRAPVRPDASEGDPKQSVARLEVRALGRAFQRRQPLPQRQVLEDQFTMAAERQRQRPITMRSCSMRRWWLGVGAKINRDEFWRRSVRLDHYRRSLVHDKRLCSHCWLASLVASRKPPVQLVNTSACW